LNSTIEDIFYSLLQEAQTFPSYDDWDAGYIAGLNAALYMIKEVYGFDMDARQD